MFKITKNGNTSSSCVVDILADSNADIANLPTKASAGIEAGSTCIVVATSEVYILNNQDEWTKL